MMRIERGQIETLFSNFNGKQIMILGDVMIDAYLRGKVERISPEAPVPVVQLTRRDNMLGGAANVALNIKSLGAEPVLCSVIGDDQKAEEFEALLAHAGIDCNGILRSKSRVTTTKFRIIGNNTQMLRVDEEIDTDLNPDDEEALLIRIKRLLDNKEIKSIIFQDYNKGVLTQKIIEKVIELAKSRNIPVAVDPKKKNFEAYQGVDLFKPNLKELREGMKTELNPFDVDALRMAVKELQGAQKIGSVMVTLSEAGIYLNQVLEGKSQEVALPAHLRSIADVSGAGDTVISVAALCMALHAPLHITAALSNLAGGLVCEYVGVVPVNRDHLLAEAIELLVSTSASQ